MLCTKRARARGNINARDIISFACCCCTRLCGWLRSRLPSPENMYMYIYMYYKIVFHGYARLCSRVCVCNVLQKAAARSHIFMKTVKIPMTNDATTRPGPSSEFRRKILIIIKPLYRGAKGTREARESRTAFDRYHPSVRDISVCCVCIILCMRCTCE